MKILLVLTSLLTAVASDDPCQPSPCGQHGQCLEVRGQAECSCPPTYLGSPPNCRPECIMNLECPENHGCVNLKCVDLCVGFCGVFATCTVKNYTPSCSCESGFIGGPKEICTGLGFSPMPPENLESGRLIRFRGNDRNSYTYWTARLDKFLEVYKKPGSDPGSSNVHNCGFNNPPPKGKVCAVNVDNWNPCSNANHYNYQRSSPCVFLKLNKIVDWIPQTYNDSSNLPALMPQDLKDFIRDHPSQANTVWVSCDGEDPADVEKIGPIHIFPTHGFPGYFFPFQNQEGYLSPLVAIHFENPSKGVVINVECKAWARNIQHDGHEQLGSVHFELLID